MQLRSAFGPGEGGPGASGVVPPARMHASLTAIGPMLLLFGGTASTRQPGGSFFLNDLYIFDTTRGAWSDELSRWDAEVSAPLLFFLVRRGSSYSTSAYHRRFFLTGTPPPFQVNKTYCHKSRRSRAYARV